MAQAHPFGGLIRFARIRTLFSLAFGRLPAEAEISRTLEFLDRLTPGVMAELDRISRTVAE